MFRPKEGSWGQGSVLSARDALDHGDGWRHHARPLRLWLDSFRRDPGRRFTASVIDAAEDRHRASMARPSDELDSVSSWGRPYFDMHAANVNTANTLLSRELKGRHLQMIAIGGSIGTCAFFFFADSSGSPGAWSAPEAAPFPGLRRMQRYQVPDVPVQCR